MVNSKKCQRCEGVQPISNFPKDLSKKDLKSIYCHNCHKKINKARRSKPGYNEKRQAKRKYSDRDRDWRLRTKYGISLEEFNRVFLSQDSRCALCRSQHSDNKNFVVDHCHKTGTFRGILCSYCNRALGMFKDDIQVLKKAIAYLKEDKNEIRSSSV